MEFISLSNLCKVQEACINKRKFLCTILKMQVHTKQHLEFFYPVVNPNQTSRMTRRRDDSLFSRDSPKQDRLSTWLLIFPSCRTFMYFLSSHLPKIIQKVLKVYFSKGDIYVLKKVSCILYLLGLLACWMR